MCIRDSSCGRQGPQRDAVACARVREGRPPAKVAASSAIEATLEGPAVVRVVQRAKMEARHVASLRQRGCLADERAQDVRAHAPSVARGPTKEVFRQRGHLEGSTRRDLDVAVAARR